MACGTPVITSTISCMPEIAGHAGLLVDPMQASSIAEAIVTLHNNKDLRYKKIQDGLVNASKFSWAKTAEKMLHVYDCVLHPHKIPQHFSIPL
jgi:glycosyltransferase involved in cell wall biosynthesis